MWISTILRWDVDKLEATQPTKGPLKGVKSGIYNVLEEVEILHLECMVDKELKVLLE